MPLLNIAYESREGFGCGSGKFISQLCCTEIVSRANHACVRILPFAEGDVNGANCVIMSVTEKGIDASELVLPKGGKVTRRGIAEYSEAVRERYTRAAKKEKAGILNEFVATTGMHRKAVIRLLNRRKRYSGKRRRRPRLYGHEAMAALKAAWEASDCLCSRRLQPLLPELVGILKRCGEMTVTPEIEAQVCGMSPSTIDRLLRRCRRGTTRRGLSTTKPGTLLKSSIPIRTFGDWNENKPGYLEADLVRTVERAQKDSI